MADLEEDAKPARSSAVVAPMPPSLGRLALGAKQTSMRFLHKYQPSAQRRLSVAQDSHKAMVQRFQLRRVSSDVNVPATVDVPARRHASFLDASSLNATKRKSTTSSPSFSRHPQSWYSAAIARLQQPIAPDGRLQQARELVLMLSFALQIIYFPFVAAFVRDKRAYSLTQLHVAFESVFVVDLLLAFNTAFYTKGGGAQLVTSRIAIARRYLRSWFVVDLLAAIPFHSLNLLTRRLDAAEQDANGAFVVVLITRLPKLVHQLNLAPILVATRAFRVTRQFGAWLQYSRYSHLLRILKLVVGVLTTAHYMACSWELLRSPSIASDGQPPVDDERQHSPFVAYANNFYYSMLLLQGEASTSGVMTTAQNAYNIACVMLGSLVLAVVFGNVAMLVANFYANSTNYQRKMERVFDTMNKMELPQELRDRIHQYYEHLWLEYECLDGDIVQFAKRLTYSLEVEVGLFKYMALVEHVPFWAECSPDFLTQVVLALDVRVYLPDDYIIRKGETGEQLFMINKGTCELVQLIKSRTSSSESGGGGGGGGGGGTGTGTGDFHQTSSASSFQEANVSDSDDDELAGDGDAAGEEEQTFYRFRQGEAFGELALLMNYRRTMSVRAVGYVEMCILSRGQFQKVLFKYPDDRKKVLVAMLKQCIKSNMLKEIAYPWKQLIASSSSSSSRPRSGSASLPPLMKALGSAAERKFSCSNRRVTMFGGHWTVNDVAAALAAKIDVEHEDASIIFGFQAADLKPKQAAAPEPAPPSWAAGAPPVAVQRQRSGARGFGSDLGRSVESFGSTPFSFATLAPAAECVSVSVRRPPTALAAAEPGAAATEARPSPPPTARAELLDAAEAAASSDGADEFPPLELAGGGLLAQAEAVKARLAASERAHAQIRESLASLAACVAQLDAVSGGASGTDAPLRAVASAPLSAPPSAPSPSAARLHRRSLAGHEHHHPDADADAASSSRRELRRAMAHGGPVTAPHHQ